MRFWCTIVTVLGIISVVNQSPVEASSGLQGDCVNNLLSNSGFEAGFSSRAGYFGNVANGWEPFYFYDQASQSTNKVPLYVAEDRSLHSGNFAQKWESAYTTTTAGLWQRVSVQSGSRVTFSAWALGWSGNADGSDFTAGNQHFRVGIDPAGGNNSFAANIQWSGYQTPGYNQWVQSSVTTTAQSGQVTLFLWANQDYPARFNVCGGMTRVSWRWSLLPRLGHRRPRLRTLLCPRQRQLQPILLRLRLLPPILLLPPLPLLQPPPQHPRPNPCFPTWVRVWLTPAASWSWAWLWPWLLSIGD